MPNLLQSFVTNTLTNTAESANNTETVVATLAGVQTRFPGQTVTLEAWARITTGTGTTAGTLLIRKASLTGTRLSDNNADNQQIAASKVCECSTNATDQPGEGSFTYVVTYQGTGDTAVTNFNAVSLIALLS